MPVKFTLPALLHQPEKYLTFYLFLLALALSSGFYFLQGRIDIPNTDEGFLWYGAIHALQGEIPIRDFQAYDPGRYYLLAPWMKLGGAGILSFRFGLSLFQALGIFFGLLVAQKIFPNRFELTLFALVLSLWSIQRYKVFEYSWVLVAVFVADWLAQKPSTPRIFLSGLLVGIGGYIGRNLGFYTFLAFGLLVFFLQHRGQIPSLIQGFRTWTAGVILGYSPMIVMWIGVPGFFQSFLESFKVYFSMGGTNVPLPIPWPWAIHYQGRSFESVVSSTISGALFFAAPLFYLGLLFQAWKEKGQLDSRKRLLLSLSCVGIFFMHYGFSRADWEHQAVGFTPFLFVTALQGSFFEKIKLNPVLLLLLLTFFSVGEESYFFNWIRQPERSFLPFQVGRDVLWVPDRTVYFLQSLDRSLFEKLKPDEYFLTAPMACNLYPLFGRKCPIRELYFIPSVSPELQLKEIEDLESKRVDWLLLSDFGVDGHDAFRPHLSHPILWKYFMEHFRPLSKGDLREAYYLFHRTRYEKGGISPVKAIVGNKNRRPS